jgi:hypothetical protein
MFTLDCNLQFINYLHFVSNKDLSGAHIILQGLVQTTKTNSQLKTLVCFFGGLLKAIILVLILIKNMLFDRDSSAAQVFRKASLNINLNQCSFR